MPAPPVSRRKRKRQNGAPPSMPLLPPEIHEDDMDEVSDEDIEFVKKNKQYARFLAKLDTDAITKQIMNVEDDDDLEKLYEKKPRVAPKNDEVTVDPVDALPIKHQDGKLEYRRVETHPTDSKTRDETENNKAKSPKDKKDKKKKAKEIVKRDTETEKPEKKIKSKTKEKDTGSEPVPSAGPLEELKAFVSEEERREEMKAKIAELATGLLANPEESISSLKELLTICSDKDDTISHLALLSAMAVFKDIIPGYRIRPPTEKELEMKVSKEVKRIRDYESSLLKCYQGYVQHIMKLSKVASAQRVALKCMCGLLESVSHFNYRDSLLRTVIPFLNAADPQYRDLASTALCTLFKDEGKHGGQATVEAVQLIADFVKENNCDLQPDVIQVFLSLSFDEDITKAVDERTRDRRDDVTQKFRSKREEKRAKRKAENADLTKEVEEDFREASNIPDADQRRKIQTVTLSAVFETFFRVLKTTLASLNSSQQGNEQHNHPLLQPCLRGLLKFSHLISLDFLGDLLNVLGKLAGGRLNVEERLQCCIAAFRVMKTNMDALTVDLKEFYVQFYNILLNLHPDRNEDILVEALQVILLDNRQHDMQRVAAFIKRLAAISFHHGTGPAMSALVTIRYLLLRYKKCRNLLENDAGGGGTGSLNSTVFLMDGNDPDTSAALSSVLWELSLLERHYNPDVAKVCRQISNMLESETLSTLMSPKDAMSAYSTRLGGFRPAVQLPSKVTKRSMYKMVEGEDRGLGPDEGVDFVEYFRLLRNIQENQVLRKEHVRNEAILQMYKRYKASKKTKKTKR